VDTGQEFLTRLQISSAPRASRLPLLRGAPTSWNRRRQPSRRVALRRLLFRRIWSDPNAAKGLVKRVSDQLGPITAIHWNAYANTAGDVLAADATALRTVFDLAVTSLVLTLQQALADLKAAKGAVLVTNGGLGLFDPNIDAMAVEWNSMGLAIANSAKHKLIGLLSHKLRADEITVGEVVILGLVKGTAWDTGTATIEPHTVADKFWEIYSKHESRVVTVS
jgi:NAD(P)-dependent dehydrogenase (short-subunit alcohol dehydrogenase family)